MIIVLTVGQDLDMSRDGCDPQELDCMGVMYYKVCCQLSQIT